MVKCPMCGTHGREWQEGAFKCPNCCSIYSKFAVLAEAERHGLEALA